MLTVTHGVETCGLRKEEIHNLDVMEILCLKGMHVVIKLYSVKTKEVRSRVAVRNMMSDRVDQQNLGSREAYQ